MATVGQQLMVPEAGWKRYDNTDINITYVGNWQDNVPDAGLWNSTGRGTFQAGDKCQFRFTGTRIRLIGALYPNRSTSIDLIIDGVKVSNFSQYGSLNYRILNADIQNLTDGEHSAQIVNNAIGGYGGAYQIDAIDIDENGELKPYDPPLVTTGNVLLRITMSDSSERQYKVTQTVADSFISWYDRAVSTGNTCYSFDDSMDGSKEYLAFEKIISFKVIPLSAE